MSVVDKSHHRALNSAGSRSQGSDLGRYQYQCLLYLLQLLQETASSKEELTIPRELYRHMVLSFSDFISLYIKYVSFYRIKLKFCTWVVALSGLHLSPIWEALV